MAEQNQEIKRPRLSLFGGFQFCDPCGQPIAVSLRKAEAVLAYLAVSAGQVASRETLAALLWGEFEQQRARQSLRQVLLALTKALTVCDNPVLRIESQQVSLVPGSITVDVVEFEELMRQATPQGLAKAAALYRGEFLVGLRLDAPDFEDWLGATQSRLRDLALKGLVDLLQHQEAEEKIGPAVATANQALRIDPFREDVHRRLMAVYSREGMRSSALAQYRLCREILDRELAVAPDTETSELYKQILDQGPEGAGDREPAESPASNISTPGETDRDSEFWRVRASLGRSAQQLVDAACVFGPRADYTLVAEASGLSESKFAAAVEEAVRGRILSVDGEELVFRRVRVCRALYSDIVPPRRKLLHAAAADAIEQVHACGLEPHYRSLAEHRREAGQTRQAIEPALHAAAAEMKRGAFGAARKTLQAALQWQASSQGGDDLHALAADLHLAMGHLAEAEGTLDSARASFKAAQTLAGRQGNARKIAEVLIALSRIRYRDGDRAEAFKTLRRGLDLAGRGGRDSVWGPVETFVSRIHLIDGRPQSLGYRLGRKTQHDRALGLRTDEAEAMALGGLAAAAQGNFDEALSDCEKALGIAETSGSEATVGVCLEAEGMVRLWRGDGQRALDCFDRSVEIAEGRGDLPRLYVLGGHRGIALLVNGRSEEAARALRDTVAMAEQINTGFFLPLFKAWLAEAAARAGEGEEAFALGRAAYRTAAAANQPWASSIAARALALAFTQRPSRNLDMAERAIRASMATQIGLGLRFELARSLVVRAKILRARGEPSQSSDSFSEAGDMFRQMGMAGESARAMTMAEALRPAS